MKLICPQCGQHHIITKDTARHIAGTIGMIGGSATALSSTLAGAQIGGRVGMVGGLPGMVIGSISGAIISGLLGAAAGSITGAQVGAIIDERVLNNYRCLSCSYEFSLSETELTNTDIVA